MNPPEAPKIDLSTKHLVFGWGMLLLFVLLGAVLETLHGFKVAWFVNVSTETRRLLWRLAHAHGTFLAVLNVVFAVTLRSFECYGRAKVATRWASACLFGATILVPLGFFAGGLSLYGNDPGFGILLTPLGAACLVLSLGLLLVVGVRSSRGVRRG